MLQKKPVIFADECSWQSWSKYSTVKTWVDKTKPFFHKINSKGLANVTVIGAVSNCLPRLVFRVEETTNQDTWKQFVHDLKTEIDKKYIQKPVTLVIDNHGAHIAYAVRPYYEGFNVLFVPAYSSFFNS